MPTMRRRGHRLGALPCHILLQDSVYQEWQLHNNIVVLARFLLGPAGSGKTFRCLTEIREALKAKPDGAPLLFLAPKQSTYQIERALLLENEPAGYTRLQVVSFERLADYVFERLGMVPPEPLSEEGRLMVLRGMLARRRDQLKLFRASTRLTGFADQLALALEEFQRHQVTPEQLLAAADRVRSPGLSLKLQDLATLLRDYLDWLSKHALLDDNALLSAACDQLAKREEAPFLAESLWVDGFADLSPLEARFLAAVARHCGRATVTFCLEKPPGSKTRAWLSSWGTTERSFLRCQKEFVERTGKAPEVKLLPKADRSGRFAKNPVLQHLQEHWSEATEYAGAIEAGEHLRLLTCADPEAEVREAAREITRHVRRGGRFRDVAVLVRRLAPYHEVFQRVFAAFDIPCFIDRRENVSHHPLAELTRSALRTVIFDWNSEDWFAALKTGLVLQDEDDIDRLENEALARGWSGERWRQPVHLPNEEATAAWVNKLLGEIMPPFERLRSSLRETGRPLNGKELAVAIREFWTSLRVEPQLQEWAGTQTSGAVSGESHLTVLNQMNAWLQNLELAFSTERLPCREWVPILEAGLSRLSVGLIPPVLDQVLVGAIDRSRNVETKLTLVLGVNETVFPSGPEQSALLTENDRAILQDLEVSPGCTARDQMARERHLAYLAFTRASERLVVSCSLHTLDGTPLNPSPFISQLRQIFPNVPNETLLDSDWREAEHPHELILPMLQRMTGGEQTALEREGGRPDATPSLHSAEMSTLSRLPAVARVVTAVQPLLAQQGPAEISTGLARRLYGTTLRTSVSRLEQFAACPFRFLVHSGLDAKERLRFEMDAREKGSFQHDVLAEFHNRLARENKRWRDVTPEEARTMVKTIAEEMARSYRDGLVIQNETAAFTTLLMTEALQDFVETMVEWMRSQYEFDPVAAEMAFGERDGCPPWELDLGGGLRLQLQGRIDRVDLQRSADGEISCVVVDYKSSPKKLDPVFIDNGVQLQLLSYLNVVRRVPDFQKLLGAHNLKPAGVFYVSLRGVYAGEKNRTEALASAAEARKQAYRHAGRFDFSVLRLLDRRADQMKGDQIPYRLKKDGQPFANCAEAMSSEAFNELLEKVESNLREMGRRIFEGEAAVAPFRKNTEIACDKCDYASVCRTDPWTQEYRILKLAQAAEDAV